MDIATKTQNECEQRVAEEYFSSLADLNCNSKPLINMLTMLAEENIEYAPVIVKVVEQHIAKVHPDFKLPILYLIDSIVKNVKSTYVPLFSQCIVNIFCGAFEKVNEKIRERMYALRQTWNEVFSSQKLYTLDVKVKCLDNNWPITAKQPSIHVNPNFLKTTNPTISTEVEKILQDKTRELLELKKRKLELELQATMKHLEEQKQFTKTAEGVIPTVDAMAAATAMHPAPIMPQPMPPQAMPGVMPPGFMGPQPMGVNPIRPPMFHPNMHNFRPHMHPNMMPEHQQMPMPQPAAPGTMMTAPINKPRVHPVNSALISSVRQRDPRLARQQNQIHQSQPVPSSSSINAAPSSTNHANQSSDSSRASKNERSSHKSSRKSPTRSSASSSTTNSSSSRSTGQRGKSSSREKDRERKQRSESKSSTNSSSSSTSLGSSSERRKAHTSKSSERHSSRSPRKQCDKDAFEIAPLSSAFKRKSVSPSTLSSPSKSRDSKRSNKSRSPRSKTSSRSPTPSLAPAAKDVDLRQEVASPEKRPRIEEPYPSIVNSEKTAVDLCSATNIDKTLPMPLPEATGLMDVDLRPHLAVPASVSALATLPNADQPCSLSLNTTIFPAPSNTVTSFVKTVEDMSITSNARNLAISSSPKVSFKIQKNINKLEKSTENLLSSTPSTTSASQAGGKTISPMSSETELDSKEIKRDLSSDDSKSDGQVSKEVHLEEDGKKRPMSKPKEEEEEPLAKKSKSDKIDTLFGTEDVDLRQLMPPLAPAVVEETAPPAPPFKMVNDSNENWDNVKNDISRSSMKKSSLEDVRAKLAKTAKLNKIGKTDRFGRDVDQRNRLAELQMNEDTQEANDEKIRTMISQAQELLESKAINSDQYKNLVKTVMSINEANKLNEAKRRESLNALRDKLNHDDGSNDSDRMAARKAVLNKRIPKLSKSQTASLNEATITISDSLSGDGSNSCGPTDEVIRLEDRRDSGDDHTQRSRRDKRGHKASKWGDRVGDAAPGVMMPAVQMQARPWNPMMAMQNQRGGPGFRPNVPGNVRPPWPNNNMPHFGKGMPPMPGMRNMPPGGPGPHMQAQMMPRPCNSIDNPQEDIVRSITIDGNAKEIRFYDEVGIVFMDVDQPCEIGFQNGQRTICIDNNEPITLHFNDGYKPFVVDGETLNIRFGFPSRELYIDENWYEIYFGGPPVTVPVRNKMRVIKAEGPPPQVNIGALRRDLVVGKINMIVDAHNVIPVFLDARVQTFKLNGKEHTIQFADNLLTILLDGTPTRLEYGGLPKSLFLGNRKYFVRFGALPQGVVAGKVQIKNMLYIETSPPVAISPPHSGSENVAALTPAISDVGAVEVQTNVEPAVPILPPAALSNINIDDLFQKLVSTGILGGSSGILPAVSNTATTTTKINAESTSTNTDTDTVEEVPTTAPVPASPAENIVPIDLSKPDSIKIRQAAIVATLYSGMQCSSCGVRFPPEQTIKYSQHLDWHFRQNRRERDSSRKAHQRKWYFDLNDWVQYEEIEDVDEREKNFFETQQNEIDITDETSNLKAPNSPVPSCPAGVDDVDRACDMCQEKFEQFYNEELEEWHLRCAIRVEDKIYHPLCYEDYKASLNPPPVEPAKEEAVEEEQHDEPSPIQIDDDNAVDIVIKVEEEAKKVDTEAKKAVEEDDDDVIVLPNEEPSVTEIYDDDEDEYVPANVTREHMGNVNNNEEETRGDLNETNESDVEIQEPNIPFTDLDNYVEKELTQDEELAKINFLNVKIKEEPKEEEDEDDGFEDVGTVLIAPDEISLHSSEDTQPQTIESSASAMSPAVDRPASTTPSVAQEENENTTEAPTTDLNISMDGNLETGDEHNLSAAGPVPSVPLASLVNKIKINITKNTVSTNSTANSSNSAAAATANSGKGNSIGILGDAPKGIPLSTAAANPISTISTIPVLCGGGTSISSAQTLSGGALYDEGAPTTSESGVSDDNSVSTISVIGSIYGNNGPTAVSRLLPANAASSVPAKPADPSPPPVEDTITYELKPALQKATLKKKEKVMCGSETSGLCSIM